MHDSVQSDNAAVLINECPFVYVAQLLGARWRPVILWKVHEGVCGYNALRAAAAPITDKMLATELTVLIERGLLRRNDVSFRPRRTLYELTERGRSMIPLLTAMQDWVATDRAAVSAR